jgi:hypothetical protein
MLRPDPQQTTPIPPHWKISAEDVRSLLTKFDREPARDTTIDADLENYARMKARSWYKVYVKLTPLTPETMQAAGVEWDGGRGWFDELVKINQRRSAEDGRPWTGSRPTGDTGEQFSDSYVALDVGDWDPQHERDLSLTMDPGEAARLDEEIERIVEVRQMPWEK